MNAPSLSRNPAHSLDLDRLDDLLRQVADTIASHIRHIDDAPVVAQTTFDAVHATIPHELPRQGTDPATVLEEAVAAFSPVNTRIGHPRFLAWITTSPAPAGMLGELLSVGFNQAPLSFKGGPAATVLEHVVLSWFADLFGYGEGWGGTLVSGGTVANLMGITVARQAHVPGVAEKGLQGLERPITLYVSDQGHMSISRSAMLLGIGHDHVRSVPSDASFRMDVDALRRMVEEDRRAGFHPFCVVAQAGSVSTGAIDPLAAIADFCGEQNIWLHVDAAYGGAALLSPTHRTKLADIHRADSVCVDPHKWFFVPLECGITLFKSSAQQKATFRAKAAYLGQESDWDLKNTNFQLSRQGRALKLWFTFRTYGTDRLAAIVERNCDMAQQFLDLAQASSLWEPAAPADLSIACAHFVPPDHMDAPWTQEELDQLHVDILAELERSGEGFLTPARIGGRAAVRLCIANHRTTPDDIRLLFDAMTNIGLRLTACRAGLQNGHRPEHKTGHRPENRAEHRPENQADNAGCPAPNPAEDDAQGRDIW